MNLAGYIDATLLRPDATREEVRALCTEARNLGCAAVCVNLNRLELAGECLQGSGVALCTVIGFPLGAIPTELKLAEIEWALHRGAREIDMVMDIAGFKDGEDEKVLSEIREATRIVGGAGAVLKVIIETALLSPDEIRRASKLVQAGGAHYVKTCTGFSRRGVSLEDVHIIREAVGQSTRIKASGGIRTHDFAVRLIKAGADRLGTSSPRDVVEEFDHEGA